jgi:hypothetical protein
MLTFIFPCSPSLSLALVPDTLYLIAKPAAVSMNPATLAKTPALAPPPGVMSDFVNSYSLMPWIVGTATVCVVLTALVLALRMFTRAVIIKSVDWTDCMSSLARLYDALQNTRSNHAQTMLFLAS